MFRRNCWVIFRLIFEEVQCTIDNAFNLRDLILQKLVIIIIIIIIIICGDRSSTVVMVLCYKSEGRWFDPRCCHWNFPLILSFRSHYGPGEDSASSKNKYQDYFLGIKAAGA
jgi:hypothetical protein